MSHACVGMCYYRGPTQFDGKPCPRKRGTWHHIRNGVDLGAGVQQYPRDLDNILRRFLPSALDAVCSDVMQQRRMVSTHRARPGQLRVLPQHRPKRRDVTRDDRLHSGFKSRDGPSRLTASVNSARSSQLSKPYSRATTTCASAISSVAFLTSVTSWPRKRACIHLKRHSAASSADFNPSSRASASRWYASRAARYGTEPARFMWTGRHYPRHRNGSKRVGVKVHEPPVS